MEHVSSESTNISSHPKYLNINSNCISSTVAIPTESPPSKLRRYLHSIHNYSINMQYKTVIQNQVIPTAALTSQEKGKCSCSHVSETESSVDGRFTGKQFCELYQLCPTFTSTPVSSKSSEIGIVKEVLVTVNNISVSEENQHNSECLNSSSLSIKKTEENQHNSECLNSSSLSITTTQENQHNSECLNSSSLSIKKQLLLKKLDDISLRSDNEQNQSIILDKLLKVFEEYDPEKENHKDNDVAMEISLPIESIQARKTHSKTVETNLEVSALESIVDSTNNNIDNCENQVGPRRLRDTEVDGTGDNIPQTSGVFSKKNTETSPVCIQENYENMSANTSQFKSNGKHKKSPVAKAGKSTINSKGGIKKASTKKVKKRCSARLKDRPTQVRMSNFDFMNAVYEDLRRKKNQGQRRRHTIDPATLYTKRRKLFSPDAWLSTLEECT